MFDNDESEYKVFEWKNKEVPVTKFTARIKSWEELKSGSGNRHFINEDNFDQEEIELKSGYFITREGSEIMNKEVELVQKPGEPHCFTHEGDGIFIYPGMIDELTIKNYRNDTVTTRYKEVTPLTKELAAEMIHSGDESQVEFANEYLDSLKIKSTLGTDDETQENTTSVTPQR